MHYESRRPASLLLFGDFSILFISLWVTLFLRYLELPSRELFNEHFVPFFLLSLVWVLVFFIAGLYDKHTEFLKRRLPAIILNAQLANIAIAVLFFFLIDYFGITPKTILAMYLAVSSVLLIVWRLYLFEYMVPNARRRALIIGEGEEIEALVREVNANSWYGFEFVRMLSSELLSQTKDARERLERLITDHDVSVIVADVQNPHVAHLAPALFTFTFSHRNIFFVDLYYMYETVFDRVPVTLLHHQWFLESVSRSARPFYDFVKRIIDILGALVFTAVLGVLYPIVWCAIKYEDGGPVFLPQERMGIFNSRIRVYKFRTMRSNEQNVWIGESQNAVTKVGAFLRKTSIDELPQVLNILKGEMSLIGPRNDLTGLAPRLAESIPFYDIRTIIKPGITGWAQTHQLYTPGNISPQSVEETKMRLSYDIFYIKHRSILLDLNIALRTIKTLLSRFGVDLRLPGFRRNNARLS